MTPSWPRRRHELGSLSTTEKRTLIALTFATPQVSSVAYWETSQSRRWHPAAMAHAHSTTAGVSYRAAEPSRAAPGGLLHDTTRAGSAEDQQEQLVHLSRVAAVGTLSGAFAHELAQPLTAILANAEAALLIAQQEAAVPAEIPDMLRDIIRDNLRAAAIIQRLHSLLERGKVERRPVDLNQIVRDGLALVRSELLAGAVRVTLNLCEQSSLVLADSVQMQQVLLNLVVNGCQAMLCKPRTKRRLIIATRLGEGEETIQCSIRDRGPGIPAHNLERIFEPFVTSKENGLGLGLSICRCIVKAHGGRLWAENAGPHGALFHFTLRREHL